MADTTLTFSTKQLNDSPGSNGLLSQVNNVLATLLDANIEGFEFQANDRQRRDGRRLDVLLGYSEPGDTVLTNPFILLTYYGKTLKESVDQVNNFKAANPSFFYSDTGFLFIKDLSSSIEPYLAFVIYSEDANASDNWKVKGGSGGSGGGANSIPISAAGISPISPAIVDSVPTSTTRAVVWEVTLQNGSGDVKTSTIIAQYDGTTVDYTISGAGPSGTVTAGVAAGLDGSDIALFAFATAGSWAVSGFRRSLPIVVP